MNRHIDPAKFLKIKNPERVLEVLFEILSAVHATQNLNELYKSIHKSLGKILNVENFFIANHDSKNDTIYFPYFVDEVDKGIAPAITTFSKTGSLTGNVIRQGRPLIFFTKELADFKNKNRELNLEPIGSPAKVWLGSPLKVSNNTIGAIVVQSYTSEDMYDESDLDILDMVSQHIAVALERKETDDAIKEQQQVLEKILELSPVGIALFEGRTFKRVNDEFVNLFGYDQKSDFEDKSEEMIYPAKKDYDDAGKIIAADAIAKDKSEFECNLVKKDSTRFPAHITIAFASANNPIPWQVFSIENITKTKNMRNEIIQHERLQGILEMAGAICHELNQPLHAILGYCDILIMDKTIEQKELNEILNVIIEQVSRINRVTKKLLGITEYKTLKYAGKNKIFDIWNAGEENG